MTPPARATRGLLDTSMVILLPRLTGPLYTCNPDDFAGIGELEVVAVPHPSGAEEQGTR